MPKVQFESVDEYIASHPKAAQSALERVRSAIRRALPQADETIAYNMPAYKIAGSTVLHFAGWKNHYSLYASSESISEKFKEELRPYEIDKGTIRFRLSEPVPEELIERIATYLNAPRQARGPSIPQDDKSGSQRH